jgi:hypothetical protein
MTKLYKVTTGRDSDQNTVAVHTDRDEADAAASTYQRHGFWDVAVKTERVDDED